MSQNPSCSGSAPVIGGDDSEMVQTHDCTADDPATLSPFQHFGHLPLWQIGDMQLHAVLKQYEVASTRSTWQDLMAAVTVQVLTVALGVEHLLITA
ncbi:hypothetical protein KIN20_007718 [Parelaphostrongylus tenuis]|uniref:Uncharacterized protein n=1 Tax=Parelaphostrongylus tenuis TaxID=148309 RepID=A0AAD5QI03_PARTN|nr:hypothetical protein KIN20_007718 [Parelaphostrongylus tenuis]